MLSATFGITFLAHLIVRFLRTNLKVNIMYWNFWGQIWNWPECNDISWKVFACHLENMRFSTWFQPKDIQNKVQNSSFCLLTRHIIKHFQLYSKFYCINIFWQHLRDFLWNIAIFLYSNYHQVNVLPIIVRHGLAGCFYSSDVKRQTAKEVGHLWMNLWTNLGISVDVRVS